MQTTKPRARYLHTDEHGRMWWMIDHPNVDPRADFSWVSDRPHDDAIKLIRQVATHLQRVRQP
jgi:hypothetical protein